MESWTEVRDFSQYQVSPDGEIMNKDRGKPKGVRLNGQGDLIVDLSRDNKRHTRKVSLLVAQAYLADPPNEAFNSVIHLNGDRTDCRAINLAWRPRWFVVEYNRMFKEKPHNVSVEVQETGEIFGTLREACVKYGLVEATAFVNAYNGDAIFPQGYHIKLL